mmetsp:Transcript_1443/g.5595  ORF Transcript_1443/g.5595 Transcript_1443/m.5595 type:complete len:239 (-) Transcript_1443:262-978(-)
MEGRRAAVRRAAAPRAGAQVRRAPVDSDHAHRQGAAPRVRLLGMLCARRSDALVAHQPRRFVGPPLQLRRPEARPTRKKHARRRCNNRRPRAVPRVDVVRRRARGVRRRASRTRHVRSRGKTASAAHCGGRRARRTGRGRHAARPGLRVARPRRHPRRGPPVLAPRSQRLARRLAFDARHRRPRPARHGRRARARPRRRRRCCVGLLGEDGGPGATTGCDSGRRQTPLGALVLRRRRR